MSQTECRWRGKSLTTIPPERFECRSVLRHAPNGTTLDYCEKCQVRNHEPLHKSLVRINQKRKLKKIFNRFRGLRLYHLKRFAHSWLQHAIAGFPRVSEETFRERERQCLSCPNRTTWGTCKLCGCGVKGVLFNKLRLPLDVCPDNPPRWGRVKISMPRWRRAIVAFLAPLLFLCSDKRELKP